jgi:hypothetical protein
MSAMTCPQCGTTFECSEGHLEPHPCWACHYTAATESAEARMKPLVDALARELEVPVVVTQTGGMIFCVDIGIGPVDAEGVHPHYVYFSEWDYDGAEDGAAFGIYRTADADQVASHWNADIAYEPANSEAIAKWAAPIIVEFARSCR